MAAFLAGPAAASLKPSRIIDNSQQAVLIRTGTAAERIAFANSAVIPLVDYGGFVLATVSGEMYSEFASKQMILRVLSDRFTLYLGSATFDTAKGEPTIADNLRISSYPAGTAGLYLVQFVGPILPRWVADLKAQGAVAYNYVPNFAFIVQMTPEQAVRIAGMPSVQWVGIYQPAYRISHLVYDEFSAPDALTSRIPMAPIPNGKPITSGQLALSPFAAASGVGVQTNGGTAAPKATTKNYDLSVLLLKSGPTSTARSLGVLAQRIYQTMDLGRMELVRISTDAANVPRIASMPGVYWVEPFYRPHVLDEVASQISAGNYNPLAPGYLPWLSSVGLTGAGVTVAVADTGVDTGVDDPNVDGDMHPELDNRVVANLWYGYLTSGEDGYGHGTHVAGIVAGNGSLGTTDDDGYLWGLGIAPEAGIINQRIFGSFGDWAGADYNDLGADAYNNGASISSNSWGISDFGSYLVDDMIYDGLVRDADVGTAGDQPLIFEFSAGNRGWGFGTPNYGSTGSPGNAKNVITTGASLNFRPTVPPPGTWPADDIDASIGFSSRGPTDDGRIKPDIVAPGGWIASLLSSASFPGWCWENIDQYHEYCGGTSMSGPMVSGGAALFVEYYRNLAGVGDPSPALTKAALVNGAVDMPPVDSPSYGSFSTGPIPNWDEGWGRMQLANVVASTGAHFYDDQQHALATGDSFSYNIPVGLIDQPVKVSVAWTDLPGTPGASTELVNDLDLTVTAPDGTLYLGNNFVDGWSAPGGSPDSKNNLENVYISTTDAQVGVYTVTVTGVNIPSGTQDYAVVVSYGGGPTSDGQVFWNHSTFRSDALAGAFLMDIDLNVDPGAPDTATVTATSDQGDSETVTVTEAGDSPGFFLGSIQFTSSASAPEDGVLTVANLGTVTLTYVDASPAGTKTDTAVIDDTPPTISGVTVTEIGPRSARIQWMTDEPATALVRYGTATPPTTEAVGRRGTDHSVSLTGLLADATYYFEVEGTDEAGNTRVDNNGGVWYHLDTRPLLPMLLVDADFGSSYETYYEASLTALQQEFDYWDVGEMGDPTVTTLNEYEVVLFFTPFCGLSGSAQNALASYLDTGGRLIISGQDIGWCSQFISGPLFGTYLHATFVSDDPFTRQVNGVAGDPIGDGLSFSISGGDGANDNYFPDVVDPIDPAVIAAVYNAGPSSRSAILHVDTGVYRVAYLAFNFEGVSSAADRDTLMDRVIRWITQMDYGVRIQPTAVTTEAVPDSTATFTFRVQNRGSALPEDTFNLAWASDPEGWATSLRNADGTPVTDHNGDGIVDTGPIPSLERIELSAEVEVPATAVDGEFDTALVRATSVAQPSARSSGFLTTLVPLPDVGLSPGPYRTVTPGETVLMEMTVRNGGGQPDTLNLLASSRLGWTVSLLADDGTTPLTDTNGDDLVDVGIVPGLESATFFIRAVVPSDAEVGAIDLIAVTASPARDPTVQRSVVAVLEYYGPGPSDWPTFHNANERRGASPNVFTPPMTQLWSSSGNLAHLFTGPIYADGKLFSTSLDQYVRARDPFTGETLWSRYLGDNSGLGFYTGTPAYADGVVYTVAFSGPPFGNPVCTAPYCGAYALDAETGAVLWYTGPSSGINFNARASLAVADGMVFGAGWSGEVFALDASNGAVVWTTETGNMFPWAGATVAAGMVWIAATDPFLSSGELFALDEMTGALRWSAPLDFGGGSAPLFARGNVYVGSWNGFYFGGSGTMYAFNAFTGEPVWSTGGFGGFWFDTPAYDGTNLYVGDFGGTFSALDAATGAVLWTADASGFIEGSVAVANGFVYGTSGDYFFGQRGEFYVIDASSGTIVDSHPLGPSGSMSSPAVGKGYVWVDDGSGSAYAFGAPGAGVIASMATVPDTASVEVGKAILFRAKALDVYGNPTQVKDANWVARAGLGSVVKVSGDTALYVAGYVAGTETLEASAGGHAATATVNVLPGPLDQIEVAMLLGGNRFEGAVSIPAGSQRTFVADTTDRFGNPIAGATLTWTVENGVGQITSNGVFTASTTVGVGFVTAASGGKMGHQQVTIVPAAPATLDIALTSSSLSVDSQSVIVATVRDAYGNANPDGEVQWTTTSTGTILLLTPDGRSILYHAPITTTPASVQLTATIGTVSRTITLTLVAGPPVGISIDAPATTVAVGGTLDFGAVVTDQFGNAVTGATIAWKTTAGSINQQGVFTAPSNPGLVVITASTAGRESFVVIEVTSGGFEQFSRQATSATSLVLLLATIVAVASSVFLFVRYRESKRELEEMRRGRGGAGGGSDEV